MTVEAAPSSVVGAISILRRGDAVPSRSASLFPFVYRDLRPRPFACDRRDRAARRLHRAAEPLRSHATGRYEQPHAARIGIADGRNLLARNRRSGARHAVGHHVRPAHLARRRRELSAHRGAGRRLARLARGLCRRPVRDRDHAARRSAALLPVDSGRADDSRLPRQGRAQCRTRARDRGMGGLRPHGARRSPGRAPQGVYRSGRSAGACRAGASSSCICFRTVCRR